ncbi:MAG: hypothetical protein WBF17_06720 [Phycisphaerae bacterium]
MATIIDIADAVAATLNAPGEPGFSQSFTAERKALPAFELADLAGLHVTVVPKGVEIAGASRSLSQHDYQIDVGVQKKVGSELEADVAALCGLVEEIAVFLRRRSLAGVSGAVWVHSANEPVYSLEHLAEKRLFTSVLTVAYRLMK